MLPVSYLGLAQRDRGTGVHGQSTGRGSSDEIPHKLHCVQLGESGWGRVFRLTFTLWRIIG